MNIFWLDNDPQKAARDQCNKHVVKMTLETAQILCHVCHVYNPTLKIPYGKLGKAHHNHPSVLWAMESKSNYKWLCTHGLELAHEYTRRYKKTHKSEAVILWTSQQMLSMPDYGITPIKLAINKIKYPICHTLLDPVDSYRYYYVLDKYKFAKWTPVNPPTWWSGLHKQLILKTEDAN